MAKAFHLSIFQFLKKAADKEIVNKKLDLSFVTGAFMDRIFVQVIYGKQIKNIHGVDINDPTYRKKWIESNLDLFLYGLLDH